MHNNADTIIPNPNPTVILLINNVVKHPVKQDNPVEMNNIIIPYVIGGFLPYLFEIKPDIIDPIKNPMNTELHNKDLFNLDNLNSSFIDCRSMLSMIISHPSTYNIVAEINKSFK